jgi:hypothetical protein
MTTTTTQAQAEKFKVEARGIYGTVAGKFPCYLIMTRNKTSLKGLASYAARFGGIATVEVGSTFPALARVEFI